MGYEIKLHIGTTFRFKNTKRSWFQEVAMVDLCKPGYDSEIYQLSLFESAEKIYLYASNGNTHIIKDMYDKSLTAVDATIVLDALKRDNKKNPYRRFEIAVALLEAMIQDMEWKENLKVVLFGY